MLYYYELKGNIFREKPVMDYQEIDVIEKPKSYEIKDYKKTGRNRINKSEIGRVIPDYLCFKLFMEEKNDELVKEIFEQFFAKELEEQRKILNEIQNLFDCVQDWYNKK